MSMTYKVELLKNNKAVYEEVFPDDEIAAIQYAINTCLRAQGINAVRLLRDSVELGTLRKTGEGTDTHWGFSKP